LLFVCEVLMYMVVVFFNSSSEVWVIAALVQSGLSRI